MIGFVLTFKSGDTESSSSSDDGSAGAVDRSQVSGGSSLLSLFIINVLLKRIMAYYRPIL